MSSLTNTPTQTTFFWFNPDADRYEAGSMDRFNDLKAGSVNPSAFSLILKLDQDIDESVKYKLINELNVAREDLFQVAC